MKAILSAAWAAILFVSALPAAASIPDYDTRSVTVDYSDLDLTHAHGVTTLERRISGAVRDVCDRQAFGLADRIQQHSCIKFAASAAAGDVGKAIAAARQQPWMQTTVAKTVETSKSSSVARQRPFEKSFGTARTIATEKHVSRTGLDHQSQR